MTGEQAAAIVGYHNRYREGVFAAVDAVQAKCPEGWRANFAGWFQNIPTGAVQVGQVRVNPHDPAFPLYIIPRAVRGVNCG